MESSTILSTVFLFLAVTLPLDVHAASWSYKDDASGPANWTAAYPVCGGQRQSPINIVTADTQESVVGEFTLVGFGADDVPTGASMVASNNGHSAVVTVTGDYMVSGASLGSTAFKVAQFHFHWGSTDTQGSEHTLNGQAYPAELHIVCYNTKYADLGTAAAEEDGLTVLGFMMGLQNEDNSALTTLFDAIGRVPFEDETYNLASPLVFATMLPSDLTKYFRYDGSLTTPGCNEVVTWNVFETPILMSSSQLAVLNSLYAHELGASSNVTLTNNYRPVQPLNDRTILRNVESSAPALYATTSLVAMCIMGILASVLTE